jgi:hypothetical protein
MNLVACDAPAGVLDEAPRTALRQDTSTEHWDGFWGDDDRYYARCTSSVGVTWFRFDDGTEIELGAVELGSTDLSNGARRAASTRRGAALASPTPIISQSVPAIPRRRTVVFRVGQGCIVGVRRAVRRPAPRVASRARSSDFSA